MVRTLFRYLLALLAPLLLVAAVGWAVLEAGWYNAGATRQHFQVVHTLLERGMHQSVRFHARDIAPPSQRDALQGAVLYKRHCQECHGGPGVAQDTIGLSMQPVPGPLVDAARRFEAHELYWIVRYGIKMSGMPAWGFHLQEDELWAVVGFLERLPHMTPDEYRATGGLQGKAMVAAAEADKGSASTQRSAGSGDGAGQRIGGGRDGARGSPAGDGGSVGGRDTGGGAGERAGGNGAARDGHVGRGGDVVRGKVAFTQWACQACHRIPGVTGPGTHVGPPLNDLRQRRFIAGSLPNNEENLVRWIMHTHDIDPQTAMPQLNVPERDARDMAAYLLAQ